MDNNIDKELVSLVNQLNAIGYGISVEMILNFVKLYSQENIRQKIQLITKELDEDCQ